MPGAIIDVELGKRVKEVLHEQGRSHGWLARQLGLSSSQLSNRLYGRATWSYLERKELARIFELEAVA